MKVALKIHWLLPSFLGICCLAAPADAGRLSSWRFDPTQNRLDFNTDEDVQPRAQLVSNPTRLVIDLPGTTTAQSPVNQSVDREIQQIRVGQLDANTTRIVVELSPGYTLDPQQIRFHGASPTQWTVQLTPQAVNPTTAIAPSTSNSLTPNPLRTSTGNAPANVATPANAASVNRSRPTVSNPETGNLAADSTTQIDGVRVTADGVFVRTRGARPDVEVSRNRRDRQMIKVTVSSAVLSPQLTERDVAINRYGISHLEFQASGSKVQITLHVAEESPDWQAAASGAGGIVMLPQGGIASVAELATPAPRSAAPSSSVDSSATGARAGRSPQLPPATAAPSPPPERSAPQKTAPIADSQTSTTATIEGIEVNSTSNQLLIHADRPVTYSGRWQSGLYQITLSPAQLASNVSGSDVGGANSPVLRARLRQQTDRTVVISLQPASGIRFGTLNMVSPQLLALEMQRSPVSDAPNPTGSLSRLDSGSRSNAASLISPSSIGLPSIQSGRLLVVLDPGHGGSDPGAVGIGGLQEKQIVLPIAQQVAAYLEQQGVQTILTRTDDSDVELEPRVQMAEQANASLFVSIHANAISMDRPEINGVETYYFSSGEQMAQVIQDSIVQGTGMNDKGIRQARFYVLRRTSMPAILIETGFVTGSEDAALLADEGFRSRMARAIAQGILQYIQKNSTSLNR
jgi:N-acetylmuramoyl-L-alanine amidase